MTTDPTMRRYRRLLYAYPRWHRQAHGPDMLTTLLDAEPLDRRGRAQLVLDGVRCRFRVPGVAAVLLAAVASLVAAGLTAAAAGYLAWQATARPVPTVRQAAALAAPVLPPHARYRYHRTDGPVDVSADPVDRLVTPIVGDPELDEGGVQLDSRSLRSDALTPRSLPLGVQLRDIHRALRGNGWRITYQDRWEVRAERGGTRIEVWPQGVYRHRYEIHVEVRSVPPPAAYPCALAGAVLGLCAGWLVAAAAIARSRRRRGPAHAAAAVLGVLGAGLSAPGAALTLVLVWVDPDQPPWLPYDFALVRPSAALGALVLVVCLGLTLARGRRTPVPDPPAPVLS